MVTEKLSKAELETLYLEYNHRRFVHPDPLEFIYKFNSIADREVAGLIASALAYGRVGQILKSVGRVLDGIPSPANFARNASLAEMEKRFRGFRHRFTRGREMAALFFSIGKVTETFGSLEACFQRGVSKGDDSVRRALGPFAMTLRAHGTCDTLIPNPSRGSACKRLNLYLRWMVRRDAVDPGGWRGIPVSKLIIPLDTHMLRIAHKFGITQRKTADMQTALEITRAFKNFIPEDPVKYDFALTREGIWSNHVR